MTDGLKPTADEYDFIAQELKAGDVVPFLGSGASVGCGLPTGGRLARLLIEAGERDRLGFPDVSGHADLARVASWYDAHRGTPWLWRNLRKVFESGDSPGQLHESLAALDGLRLIVTTNYDDLIEAAFIKRWEDDGYKAGRKPWIVVDRGDRESVSICQPDQPWQKQKPNQLEKAMGKEPRPIIFKMHGDLSRKSPDDQHYLITEEQYVNFLGRGDRFLIPAKIETTMQMRNLLFLGYGLRDWNVRVLMSKLKNKRVGSRKAWAVVSKPEEEDVGAREAERFLWSEHYKVTIFEVELDEFAKELQARLRP
jgi:hypothetical protein